MLFRALACGPGCSNAGARLPIIDSHHSSLSITAAHTHEGLIRRTRTYVRSLSQFILKDRRRVVALRRAGPPPPPSPPPPPPPDLCLPAPLPAPLRRLVGDSGDTATSPGPGVTVTATAAAALGVHADSAASAPAIHPGRASSVSTGPPGAVTTPLTRRRAPCGDVTVAAPAPADRLDGYGDTGAQTGA